jgi:hypothetical protein
VGEREAEEAGEREAEETEGGGRRRGADDGRAKVIARGRRRPMGSCIRVSREPALSQTPEAEMSDQIRHMNNNNNNNQAFSPKQVSIC